jgi:hypothetical protein
MSFIKRLLGGKKKVIEPARGAGVSQTEEQQDATRRRMEADMQASKERRESDSPKA